jgi:HlyD family secretion protein
MKKAITRIIVLAVLVGAGYGAYRYYQQRPSKQSDVATAEVVRGDVVIRAFTRGELKAVRSASVVAPNLNGTVQVTQLAPLGSMAKENDLIVEYDDSERQAALEQQQLSLQSTDESIKQTKANLQIQQSNDEINRLTAKYDVRRAELNVQTNPIQAAITAKEYDLAKESSVRALSQTETTIKAKTESYQSQLSVLNQTRTRNLTEIQRELARIAQTRALSQITGLVSVKQNRGNNFNFGQQQPDIRVGDTLSAGMQVAEVLDVSEMEVWAKVGELDRSNLTVGQGAVLQFDAIPDKKFHGKIKSLSGTATADVYSGDPAKKFDVVFSVDMRELLAGVGMKQADIERMMETAKINSQKKIINQVVSAGGGPGGGGPGGPGGGGPGGGMMMGGGPPGGFAGMMGGGPPGGFGGDMPAIRTSGGRGRGGLSEADQKTLADLQKQLAAAKKDADKAKIQKQIDDLRAKAPAGRGRGGFPGGGRGMGEAQGGMAGFNEMGMPTQETEADKIRKAAKLPPPPEEDSSSAVLVRPGLLAAVEVEVERMTNVINVPAQAVFSQGNDSLVYVRGKDGKFQARKVKLVKQSESRMVLDGGVSPGDVVAMEDPTAKKKGGKSSDTTNKSSSAASSLPGAK